MKNEFYHDPISSFPDFIETEEEFQQFKRQADCQKCGGSGVIIMTGVGCIAACCGNVLPSGECCGDPIPEAIQIQEPYPCICSGPLFKVDKNE